MAQILQFYSILLDMRVQMSASSFHNYTGVATLMCSGILNQLTFDYKLVLFDCSIERKGLEWSLTIIFGQIVIESESTKSCMKR